MLNYVNHVFSSEANINEVSGLILSEKIATFYGVFLLFQGLVEFAKEIGLGFDGVDSGVSKAGDDSSSADSGSIQRSGGGVQQIISPTLVERSDDVAEAVCWAAASYVSLTPATHVMVLEQGVDDDNENNNSGGATVLYKLGDFSTLESLSDVNIQAGALAAIETVYQSKGGRVSIPVSHPAASLLPENNQRCLLLQQVHQYENEKGGMRRICLLVGSDQLLATFTKNDLKWLGSLGGYLNNKFD